jgi:hypothetical protein
MPSAPKDAQWNSAGQSGTAIRSETPFSTPHSEFHIPRFFEGPAHCVLGALWVSAGSPHLFRCKIKGFRGGRARADKNRMCQPEPSSGKTQAPNIEGERMNLKNNLEDPAAAAWRSDLERRMREIASSPELHFAVRATAVMDTVEQRELGAPVPLPGPIEDRLDSPEPCDRVVALMFFFQVAAFVRILTPRMLANLSDAEIKHLALCLGLYPDARQSGRQQNP